MSRLSQLMQQLHLSIHPRPLWHKLNLFLNEGNKGNFQLAKMQCTFINQNDSYTSLHKLHILNNILWGDAFQEYWCYVQGHENYNTCRYRNVFYTCVQIFLLVLEHFHLFYMNLQTLSAKVLPNLIVFISKNNLGQNYNLIKHSILTHLLCQYFLVRSQ